MAYFQVLSELLSGGIEENYKDLNPDGYCCCRDLNRVLTWCIHPQSLQNMSR